LTVVWFGIDVSKKKLACAYEDGAGKARFTTVDNSQAGFIKLVSWAGRAAEGKEAAFCMEATGDYYLACALHLADEGLKVSVVNPAWIKHFGQSMGRLNKTDKADSRLICEYAAQRQPAAWALNDPHKRELFRLNRRRGQLIEAIKAESNRRECPAAVGKFVMAMITKSLKFNKAELRNLETKIEEFIAEVPQLAEDRVLLGSLPRFGLASTLAVLAEMPSVDSCASAKSFAAAAGGNPTAKQSGTCLSSSSMNRGGRRVARSMLWMPVLGWLRDVPEIRALYDRLRARGRAHKQAMVACIHKMLMIVYGILKHRKPYKTSENIVFAGSA
jgi:transposase